MEKYLALRHGARSVRHDLEPNIFAIPARPNLVKKYITLTTIPSILSLLQFFSSSITVYLFMIIFSRPE